MKTVDNIHTFTKFLKGGCSCLFKEPKINSLSPIWNLKGKKVGHQMNISIGDKELDIDLNNKQSKKFFNFLELNFGKQMKKLL